MQCNAMQFKKLNSHLTINNQGKLTRFSLLKSLLLALTFLLLSYTQSFQTKVSDARNNNLFKVPKKKHMKYIHSKTHIKSHLWVEGKTQNVRLQ